jgi:hypothetical protein
VAYEYDIFLSYKRHPEARQWLVEHFQPLLEHYVELELGRKVAVFRDDQDVEVGGTWPAQLGGALGKSRTLVALWTRTYFHSEWCTQELSTMLAREQDARFRTPRRPAGLVFPVVLHDCEQLPSELAPLQSVAMQDCYAVRMARDSQRAEFLEQHIAKRLAPSVAPAVEAAPKWRAEWPLETPPVRSAARALDEPVLGSREPAVGSHSVFVSYPRAGSVLREWTFRFVKALSQASEVQLGLVPFFVDPKDPPDAEFGRRRHMMDRFACCWPS